MKKKIFDFGRKSTKNTKININYYVWPSSVTLILGNQPKKREVTVGWKLIMETGYWNIHYQRSADNDGNRINKSQ